MLQRVTINYYLCQLIAKSKSMKVLITGASGFIGSFLCEKSLDIGYDTWAVVRKTSSRCWLQHDKLNFITLDLGDKTLLKEQLKAADIVFDVVIHAAGKTKCRDKNEFYFHNYQCTCNLVEALAELKMMPHQFIYMSSLSAVYGSEYGKSKLKTEDWLRNTLKNGDTNLVVFRPTGVYGPREKDYFLMVKSIKKHVDFAVGFKPQLLTFVYVQDLVDAVFKAVEDDIKEGMFCITDGEVYSSRTFSELIQKELGVKHVLHITAPLWFLKVVSVIAESIAHVTGTVSTLNRDKYKIMAQRDWTCDIEPMKETLGFQPKWQLPRGVKETIAWYKKENWI